MNSLTARDERISAPPNIDRVGAIESQRMIDRPHRIAGMQRVEADAVLAGKGDRFAAGIPGD